MMEKEKNYFVNFEMFYGVHEGIPGCPINESENVSLNFDSERNIYSVIRDYLIDGHKFPGSSGFLKAKILDYDSRIELDRGKWVKIGSLELLFLRNKKKEGLDE
jgi:hypothetical protein